jgi:3-carboxy-cis,cis-muconate cycloisomerase
MLSGLEVDADRMRANLDLTRGTIVSEAVMMGLGPYLGRQRAHDLVYDICRKVAASGEPLVEVLARDGDVSRHLTRAQLEKICDPAAYLGLAGEMVDKVLAREGRPMDR